MVDKGDGDGDFLFVGRGENNELVSPIIDRQTMKTPENLIVDNQDNHHISQIRQAPKRHDEYEALQKSLSVIAEEQELYLDSASAASSFCHVMKSSTGHNILPSQYSTSTQKLLKTSTGNPIYVISAQISAHPSSEHFNLSEQKKSSPKT